MSRFLTKKRQDLFSRIDFTPAGRREVEFGWETGCEAVIRDEEYFREVSVEQSEDGCGTETRGRPGQDLPVQAGAAGWVLPRPPVPGHARTPTKPVWLNWPDRWLAAS